MTSKFHIKDKSETGKTIKVAPFKKEIRKTTPHKHNNYFEILYLSQGSGHHYIDSRKFEIKPPVMFFIRKEQIHHWELDSEPDGFVIIIKKAFMEKSLDSELRSLFTRMSEHSSLFLGSSNIIDQLYILLVEENKYEGEYSFHIIEGLLKALLAKILEVAKPVANKTKIKPNLYQSFLSLLDAEQIIKNKVQYYATLLNTSPQNLNAACRKAVNQPAAEVLAEFVISEAKRLLHYTDKTIAEISFALDFRDPSHFVKYFKRITGLTPHRYRVTFD